MNSLKSVIRRSGMSIVNRQSSIVNCSGMSIVNRQSSIVNCSGMSIVNRQSSIVNSKGFTLLEVIVVVAIMGILATIAYSQLRTPKERIACKNIFSAMHLAKMRAVATGYDAYVSMPMGGAPGTNNFFTTFLDSDENGYGLSIPVFAAGDTSEFTDSQFSMSDTYLYYLGVFLPAGVYFSQISTSPSASIGPPGVMGIDFNGNIWVGFDPKGMASSNGIVNVVDSDSGKGCAVVVSIAGMIKMSNWDGSNWSTTW